MKQQMSKHQSATRNSPQPYLYYQIPGGSSHSEKAFEFSLLCRTDTARCSINFVIWAVLCRTLFNCCKPLAKFSHCSQSSAQGAAEHKAGRTVFYDGYVNVTSRCRGVIAPCMHLTTS